MKINILHYELELLAEKGVYWDKHSCLFVADTHFGKESTFRSHLIPVPDGSTAETLKSITKMVERTKAQTLVILGDMFHARSSLSKTTHEELRVFRERHATLQIKLVPGNHDRPLGTLPKAWNIEIVPCSEFADGLAIGHEPEIMPSHVDLMLCGHLHPALQLKSAMDVIGRLPCFWWHRQRLILPAIGDFTGCSTIQPTSDDAVWVIADGTVIASPLQSTSNLKHSAT